MYLVVHGQLSVEDVLQIALHLLELRLQPAQRGQLVLNLHPHGQTSEYKTQNIRGGGETNSELSADDNQAAETRAR